MHLSMFSLIPLGILLFIAEPTDAGLFPHAVIRTSERLHRHAIKHSHSIARDLRVAFNAILVAQPGESPRTRSLYCSLRANTDPMGSGSLGPGSSSSSNGTNASSSSSSSSPSSSSSSSSNSGSGSSYSSSSSATHTSSKTSSSSAPSATSASPWKVIQSHSGSSFFDGWDFFTGSDPTNGIVTYIDEASGRSSGLVAINGNGNAIMGMETTGAVSNTRKSIRITTKTGFNGGLVIMDSIHIPTGCGTWPAFWTNGPNWPAGGEIDIVEGVSDYTNNQATIHTNEGCTLSSSSSSQLGITGSVVGGTNCAALTTGNQGCGVRSNSNKSFGSAFNKAGGGVYAMLWDNSGVHIWFFSRGSIPSDIDAEAPLPNSWGSPLAFWQSSSCNPWTFFHDHSAIFTNTLCGDWAAGVWSSSGLPGQEQSCAQRTGYPTCEAFIRENGATLTEAYWEVKSVKIYQD